MAGNFLIINGRNLTNTMGRINHIITARKIADLFGQRRFRWWRHDNNCLLLWRIGIASLMRLPLVGHLPLRTMLRRRRCYNWSGGGLGRWFRSSLSDSLFGHNLFRCGLFRYSLFRHRLLRCRLFGDGFFGHSFFSDWLLRHRLLGDRFFSHRLLRNWLLRCWFFSCWFFSCCLFNCRLFYRLFYHLGLDLVGNIKNPRRLELRDTGKAFCFAPHHLLCVMLSE